MIAVQGKLFDGKSSGQKQASLTLNQSDQLFISIKETTGSDSHPVQITQFEISSRLGNSARYVNLGELGRFETTDNDAVDQIAKILEPDDRSSFLYTLESNLGLILVAIAVTVLFVAATVRYGIPIAGDKIADALPDKTTDIIETQILAQLENRWFKPSKLSAQRTTELNDLFAQVVEKLGAQDKNYVFKLRDAKETIGANALAFPSGTVVMTDQLVELAEDDVQLAGILAHEVGHLQGKHSLRQLVRASILTFLVAFIAGDVSGASSTLIAAPVAILQLSYSREFETEADSYALDYLGCDKHGLAAMAAFFTTLASYSTFDDSATGTSNQSADDSAENKPLQQQSSKDTIAASNADNSESSDEIVEQAEEQNTFGNFLATHPASAQRSAMFANHYAQECQ